MRRGEDFDPGRDDSRAPLDRPPRAGVRPRQVLVGIVAIVLIAFAAANFKEVEVNFLVFTTTARVVTVIVVSALLGFVAGWFIGRPARADRRALRELREKEQKD